MQALIKEALCKKHWAVIGATQSTNKFGYKIFMRLRQNGFEVKPVNPRYKDIDGIPTASCISDVSGVEVVNMVVSPERSKEALDEIIKIGNPIVWFQPGAYDHKTIAHAEDLGLKVIYGYCVLVEMGSMPVCPL